jgi:hypothetical protein
MPQSWRLRRLRSLPKGSHFATDESSGSDRPDFLAAIRREPAIVWREGGSSGTPSRAPWCWERLTALGPVTTSAALGPAPWLRSHARSYATSEVGSGCGDPALAAA